MNYLRPMEYARQYFEVGEMFTYTPLNDRSVEIAVKTMDCSDVAPDVFSSVECETHCAICKWCCVEGNNALVNGVMVNYIPECNSSSRKDNKQVYFREVL